LKNTPCLFANSNHRHEAAGESAFAAVAEKEVGAAGGAKAAGEDVLRAQAGGEELRAVGFGKIQVDIARRGLVARGRHAQPLQRIGLIAGARLIEIAGGVSELRGEFGYEVGADLVTKFTAQFADTSGYFDEPRTGDEPNPLQWLSMAPPGHQPPPRNVHLDLPKANRAQLLAAGLRPQNIFPCGLCTACRTDFFFSHRREGALSGRLMSVIGIRK